MSQLLPPPKALPKKETPRELFLVGVLRESGEGWHEGIPWALGLGGGTSI